MQWLHGDKAYPSRPTYSMSELVYLCPESYADASGICENGSKHRFLRVERQGLSYDQYDVLRLRLQGHHKDQDTQRALNPLFAHCLTLSASEDVSGLHQLDDAVFAYWKHCMAFDETDMGVGPLEALDAALSAIPDQVREYVVSQSSNDFVQTQGTL